MILVLIYCSEIWAMPLIVKDGIDIETKGSPELGGHNTYLDKKKVQVLSLSIVQVLLPVFYLRTN